jgi:hypothetical protein
MFIHLILNRKLTSIKDYEKFMIEKKYENLSATEVAGFVVKRKEQPLAVLPT